MEARMGMPPSPSHRLRSFPAAGLSRPARPCVSLATITTVVLKASAGRGSSTYDQHPPPSRKSRLDFAERSVIDAHGGNREESIWRLSARGPPQIQAEPLGAQVSSTGGRC